VKVQWRDGRRLYPSIRCFVYSWFICRQCAPVYWRTDARIYITLDSCFPGVLASVVNTHRCRFSFFLVRSNTLGNFAWVTCFHYLVGRLYLYYGTRDPLFSTCFNAWRVTRFVPFNDIELPHEFCDRMLSAVWVFVIELSQFSCLRKYFFLSVVYGSTFSRTISTSVSSIPPYIQWIIITIYRLFDGEIVICFLSYVFAEIHVHVPHVC